MDEVRVRGIGSSRQVIQDKRQESMTDAIPRK
jgi:hypothetical protein